MSLTETTPAPVGWKRADRDLRRELAASVAVKTTHGASGTKKRTVEGILQPFGVWAEIDSIVEGHFMEMFMAGSLDKTITEQRDRMRWIIHHGRSGSIVGGLPVGTITDLHADRSAAYYECELFEGLPDYIYEGLEAEQYGTSLRYDLIKPDYRLRPAKGEHNPEGLDELRVLEAKIIEFGPTPFPIYDGTTARLRSATDDALLLQMAEDPERLQELVKRTGIVVGEVPTPPADETDEPPKRRRTYERAGEFVSRSVWEMHPDILGVIVRIFAERKRGYTPDADELAERIGLRAQSGVASTAADEGDEEASPVAVIPIKGPIVPHAGMFDNTSSEMRSVEAIQAELREAVADDNVKGILLEVDSPGGHVSLIEELAVELREARDKKPLWASVNTMAASAAYHLASQASELAVTPSGTVGSIGVYSIHENIASKLEQEGVEPTVVSAGKYKFEGNPFEPLTDEAREEMQRHVDAAYKRFVRSVAKGRGVTEKTVEAEFGQGRMVLAEEAVERGMATRVATFDQTRALLEKTVSKEPPKDRAAALEDKEPERSDATTPPATASRSTRQRSTYLERRQPRWKLP